MVSESEYVIRGLCLSDWPWIKERINPVLSDDTQGCVVEHDQEIIGAVVMDNFTPTHCQIHLALDDPRASAGGRLAKEVFNHVFNVIGLDYLLAWTSEENQKSLELQKRLGFKPIFTLENGFDKGVNRILSRLDKSDCKYINEETENGRHDYASSA